MIPFSVIIILSKARMIRYSVLPATLYRFQSGIMPKLRERSAQFKKGQTSFDFVLASNKLYNSTEGDVFMIPNGLSLRPLGVGLSEILSNFKAKYIYELPKDLPLPNNFVLIHEHTDHYSLQTRQSIQPEEFCLQAKLLFEAQQKITYTELRKKLTAYWEK